MSKNKKIKIVPKTDAYPYLIFRATSCVYIPYTITFVKDETIKPATSGITIVLSRHKYKGRLTKKARQAVIASTLHTVTTKKIRICAVFGPKDCVYCEPDGTTRTSNEPPSVTYNL